MQSPRKLFFALLYLVSVSRIRLFRFVAACLPISVVAEAWAVFGFGLLQLVFLISSIESY